MSLAFLHPKDPDEVIDYDLDWSRQLSRDADTIATSAWTVPSGITQDDSENTDTLAKIWLSGGTNGESYLLINHITTAAGRVFERTVKLRVKSR